MRKILLTGGLGYIGSVLRQKLDCDVLDAGWFGDERVTYRTDIRDVTREHFYGYDTVVHLAGLCNDPLCMLDTEIAMEINYDATIGIANLAKESGVKKFFFMSTQAAYGKAGDEELTEDSPINPLTVYASSKVRAERFLKFIFPDALVFRLGTVFGPSPSFRSDIIVNQMAMEARKKGVIRVFGPVNTNRTLVHIEDVCDNIVRGLRENISGVYNVSQGNYTIYEVAKIVGGYLKIPIEFTNDDGGDSRSYRVRANDRFPCKRTIESAIDSLTTDVSYSKRVVAIKSFIESGRMDSTLRFK